MLTVKQSRLIDQLIDALTPEQLMEESDCDTQTYKPRGYDGIKTVEELNLETGINIGQELARKAKSWHNPEVYSTKKSKITYYFIDKDEDAIIRRITDIVRK